MEARLIHNETEYQAALKRMRQLWGAEEETPEYEEADVLALLINKYEEEHYPIDDIDPIEHIRIRMEVLGLQASDMVPYFGDKTTVSKVLGRKRPLSLNHIRNLHKGLGIPAEVLIAETTLLDKEAA